jgi:hypothetical protein
MSRTLSLASLVFVAASTIGAQEPSTTTFGFGTTLNPAALVISDLNTLSVYPTGFNNILFPIRTPGYTIEPEVGFFRTSSSNPVQTGGATFQQETSTFTNTRLGVGILKHLEKRENLEPYFGPRLGIIRSTTSETSAFSSSSPSTTANSWYASGVLGAQYFFSRHFSLGGEAQLTYTSVDSGQAPGSSSNAPDPTQTNIGTAALVTLRCYF